MIKRGLPTVVLVGEDFVTPAKAVARSQGLAELPSVTFPRRINASEPADIEAVADRLAEKIVGLLNGSLSGNQA